MDCSGDGDSLAVEVSKVKSSVMEHEGQVAIDQGIKRRTETVE